MATNRSIMMFLILLCFVGGALAERSCPENQHYESCGTACPLTCDNYNNPPKACVLMCNPGCHCDEGYVKIPDGRCINPIQCPMESEEECGENERFNECGTDCPLTCANYRNPPQICNMRCKVGCECVDGYVRSADGYCVLPENCPADECGENEQYNECGTACPLTCANYQNPPEICNLSCKIGCECAKGYIRSSDERCVLPKDCKKDCRSKPDGGMCRGHFPMWYYNPDTSSCEEFIYGGCQGNGNRYTSEDECLKQCLGVQAALDRPDCDKNPESGLCNAYIERYYYDQKWGMCKKFIYGGCGGNRNNFRTEAECYNKCGALASDAKSACDQDKEVGSCFAAFRRYFYNKQTGKCEKFIYGGCRGNENNFKTKAKCEATCVA